MRLNLNLQSEKPADRIWVSVALLVMGLLMLTSVAKDSLTTDETLYLPTGYYYLTEQKANIGYEHPPLIRDLAAFPLLFLPLKPASDFIVPASLQNLETAVWSFGERFLYNESESPDTILFYARTVMVLLTLLCGFCLFRWSKELFGPAVARLSLLLFVFSPFFLAHGRYVTMDVPSAFACLCVFYFFHAYLRAGTWQSAVKAGAALGFALLVKFPLLSLVPFLAVTQALWLWVTHEGGQPWDWKRTRRSLKLFLLLLAKAAGFVYVVYAFHLWNYPQSEHIADMTRTIQASRGYEAGRLLWLPRLAEFQLLRPWIHYLYGMSWQLSRTGAFGYFMGEGSYGSWRWFYPFGYFAKNPTAFHLLTLLALVLALRSAGAARASFSPALARLKAYVRENAWTVMTAAWILYYLYILIFVNSGNTGSRYLMPVLPFLFIFIARALSRARGYVAAAVVVLLVAQAVAVLRVHPSYVSFFNVFVGGPKNGSEYLVDTDADWGQDKRRLAEWVNEKGIAEIQVVNSINFTSAGHNDMRDFTFNSSEFQYYLGSHYRPYIFGSHPKGWLAVPLRVLRWGQTSPAEHNGWYSQSYGWLHSYEPVARIGDSIWVYYFE